MDKNFTFPRFVKLWLYFSAAVIFITSIPIFFTILFSKSFTLGALPFDQCLIIISWFFLGIGMFFMAIQVASNASKLNYYVEIKESALILVSSGGEFKLEWKNIKEIKMCWYQQELELYDMNNKKMVLSYYLEDFDELLFIINNKVNENRKIHSDVFYTNHTEDWILIFSLLMTLIMVSLFSHYHEKIAVYFFLVLGILSLILNSFNNYRKIIISKDAFKIFYFFFQTEIKFTDINSIKLESFGIQSKNWRVVINLINQKQIFLGQMRNGPVNFFNSLNAAFEKSRHSSL